MFQQLTHKKIRSAEIDADLTPGVEISNDREIVRPLGRGVYGNTPSLRQVMSMDFKQ
jgi:hypothetical protein